MTFRMHVKTQVPGLRQVAMHLGVDEQGDVQKYVTDEIVSRLPKYMPRKSGRLVSSIKVEKPTKVFIDGPYARRQFFGKKKSGEPFEYDRSSNPLAGPHWDSRLVACEGKAIAAKVQRYVRTKG